MSSNNMIFMSRPTQSDFAQASCGGCRGLGPTDPTDVHLLSPRKNREKVREQIKDSVLLSLGAPRIKIELDDQQLDFAVDKALMVFEDYAPMEYFQYYTFKTTPGQSVYTMPPDIGLIRSISYQEISHPTFAASDVGGSIPLEYMGNASYGSISGGMNPIQPVWGKMGEWVLYKQYEAMYSRISSQEGGWEWIGGMRNIKLYPVPWGNSSVVVHYLQKRPDFKEINQAMIEGALAQAQIILGEIRSRIVNPPGPNGGIQLNGADILQRGIAAWEKWEERLINRYSPPSFGPMWGSYLILAFLFEQMRMFI